MSTIRVYLNLDKSEIITKVGKDAIETCYYKGFEVKSGDDSEFYYEPFDMTSMGCLKYLDVLSLKLKDKVQCIYVSEMNFLLPAHRQYGLYRLGSSELTLLPSDSNRREYCTIVITSRNLDDLKEIILGVLDGTLSPERYFEVPQVVDQKEIIKKLKEKNASKKCEDSVQARLLKCQAVFAKEKILAQAEDAWDKTDEELCDKLLTEIGF